jgi:hypothetical protein
MVTPQKHKEEHKNHKADRKCGPEIQRLFVAFVFFFVLLW